jgi:ABC-type transport system involved in multi-copper enzyme maturation permease subunit
MTAGTIAPRESRPRAGADGFGHLLHAEWTKFRTVRGWVIAMIFAALLTVGFGLLGQDSCSNGNAACTLPLGPGGEAVTDSFYFVRQPLDGNGSITVQVTSLTGLIPNGSSDGRVRAGSGAAPSTANMHKGLEPWSKAGIIIEKDTSPGAAYAAMMVTGAHGVRMQYDYTQDAPGLAGAVSAANPRWLRLTRFGDTITGYDSADGTSWTKVGTATLPGLRPTVQAGLFAASPVYTHVVSASLGASHVTGGPTLAIAAFDHTGLRGRWTGGWTGDDIGGTSGTYPQAPGGFRQSGDRFAVTGSGDIAPDVPGSAGAGGVDIAQALVGTFAGLIVVIVVGTMFITAEYRRGLIRTTLTASPRRGQVLLAKAIVTGLVTFVVGLVATAVALPVGEQQIRKGGSFIDPVSMLTEVRLVAGTAALLAVAAILALALGTMLRRSAVAVTVAIVVIVVPYILATALSTGVSQWLLRVTPAAGFAIQQAYPKYPQLGIAFAGGGYYPLAPWAGFAVLCGWAAAALGLAVFLLHRRDA